MSISGNMHSKHGFNIGKGTREQTQTDEHRTIKRTANCSYSRKTWAQFW